MSTELSTRRNQVGFRAVGRMIYIVWPKNKLDYVAIICVYYPTRGKRLNGYYKLAYILEESTELINLDDTQRL